MAITDWPLLERPREKLLAFGVKALSDAELLAIFLRTGVRGKTAVDLARDLLKQFNGLRSLLEANAENFQQGSGLGVAKYTQLQAVLEMGRRHLYAQLQQAEWLPGSLETKQYLLSKLRHHQREVFACLFLDTQHRILDFEEIFFGTIDCADIYPREIVKRVLYHNAAAVILAHNHPSGNTKPSAADKEITHQLGKALSFVGVKVLDHMIVGANSVASFAELGLL